MWDGASQIRTLIRNRARVVHAIRRGTRRRRIGEQDMRVSRRIEVDRRLHRHPVALHDLLRGREGRAVIARPRVVQASADAAEDATPLMICVNTTPTVLVPNTPTLGRAATLVGELVRSLAA
jgi:hypothetical protein